MARNFVVADSDEIDSNSNAHHNQTELSMMVWIYSDDTPSGLEMPFGARATDSVRLFYNTSGTIQMQIAGTVNTDDSATVTTGQWQHIGINWDGSNLHRWLDATNTGSNDALSDTTDCNYDMRYGCYSRNTSGADFFFDGKIAMVCMATAGMPDERTQSLAHGIHPFVYKDSNTAYIYELWGFESPEPDLISTGEADLVNTPAEHRPGPPVELVENYL